MPEDTPHHLPGKGREKLVWLEYGKEKTIELTGWVGWLVGWLVEFNVLVSCTGLPQNNVLVGR